MPEVGSASEAFALIEERFDPSQVEGIVGTIQMDLSGDAGGKWAIKLDNGSMEIIEGGVESPTATISMVAEDFVSMVNGKLNAVSAFMTGKIKVQGDMALVMRLQSIFS